MKNKSNSRGSSAIELLIVIGVISLMAAISIPYIRSHLSNLKLTNVAKKIATDLRYAQQLTVSEQNIYYAKIIQAENKCQIIQENSEDVIRENSMEQGITFQSITGFTDNEIVFNYFGAALEAGTIILLNSATGNTIEIEVKPSGYINL